MAHFLPSLTPVATITESEIKTPEASQQAEPTGPIVPTTGQIWPRGK